MTTMAAVMTAAAVTAMATMMAAVAVMATPMAAVVAMAATAAAVLAIVKEWQRWQQEWRQSRLS
jgi:hypothetical protein